jgi:hypothetical protein
VAGGLGDFNVGVRSRLVTVARGVRGVEGRAVRGVEGESGVLGRAVRGVEGVNGATRGVEEENGVLGLRAEEKDRKDALGFLAVSGVNNGAPLKPRLLPSSPIRESGITVFSLARGGRSKSDGQISDGKSQGGGGDI